MKRILTIVFIFNFILISFGLAEDEASVKYKNGKRIDFESLLVEGESKKPEMSVVTGNIGEKDKGLLKFRKNFNDFMANDAGEEIK